MSRFIRLFILILLSIAISGCGDDSSSKSDTDESILDVYRVSSTLGTISYGGEGSKRVLWDNYTTAESGGSYTEESGAACHLPCTIFSCPCTITWRVIIPLTDGANDIVLTDYYSSYSETVLHTDNGPPEVLSYGEIIPEGYENTYIYVHFNEYMNPTSINDETIIVEDLDGNKVEGLDVRLLSYAYYQEGDKAIIYKRTDYAGYTVRVTTGVTDYWGTPMSVEYSWAF